MTIEVNGRMVAGFVLGMVCGAVALTVAAAGQVGRIQRERDDLRAEAQKLNAENLRVRNELQSLKDAQASAPAATANPDDQGLAAVGNALHPGLGTAAVMVKKFVQKSEAGNCPTGSQPMTDPNWKGYKCVEVAPQ